MKIRKHDYRTPWSNREDPVAKAARELWEKLERKKKEKEVKK